MTAHSKTILIGLDAAVASLVEGYLSEGRMPNLAALIARGTYTPIRSVFPGVTPINWATVSTGAYPGTHGVTDFLMLDPGDPLDGGRDGFVQATYRAETLWQAACRAGLKAATLNFPGAEARQHDNHLWIAGRGSPAAKTTYAISNTMCYATPPYDRLRDAVRLDLRGSRAAVGLKPAYAPGSGPTLRFDAAADGVVVFDADGAELCFLLPGRPGPWLWGDFTAAGAQKRGSFRLELAHFDPARPAFAIYVSQIASPRDIADPPEMGEALVDAVGPFVGYSGARGCDRGWTPASRMVEEGRYKGLWQAQAARLLVEQFGCDLVMLKWHLLDHLQHAIWGRFDPISPWYEAGSAPAYERLIFEGYAAADAMIGALLPLLDQGVTLVVVSDHGHLPHLKAVSINNLLAQQGLIAVLPGETDPPPVDWPRTRAFGGPALGHIRVNLAGRQPQGCVPEEEYEQVRQQLIDLLLGLRDADGSQPVAQAIRREEAHRLGLWGDRVGDVVYLMSPGWSGDFNWCPLSRTGEIITALGPEVESDADYGEGRFIAGKFQSVHGCGDPGESLGRGTELAVLAMAGPGVQAGAKLAETPEMVSVAPTVCKAADLPLPAQAEGGVLEPWLRG
jgi:predicted AlkP superfamily phosphohydrolase/phosphomutase